MKYTYSYQSKDKAKSAMALGLSVDASTRHGREVANFIRGRNAEEAVKTLEAVIEKKLAVPYRFFKTDLSHKTGVGPARYPVKTSKAILAVIKNAMANAQTKGLAVSELALKHISVQKASAPWHSGRKSRRKMKRANIEVCLEPAVKLAEGQKADAKKDKLIRNLRCKPVKKHKNGGNR